MPIYQTIATDERNDIYLDGAGNLALADDREALANIVLNVFRTNYGELQFNTDDGIPYFATIFNNAPNVRMFEAFLRDRALSVPGIESVGAFSYTVSETPVEFGESGKKSNESRFNYRLQLNSDIGVITVDG